MKSTKSVYLALKLGEVFLKTSKKLNFLMAAAYCITNPQILGSAHTVYLCVLCGSENKQRLFPYTALTDWFV